MREQGLEPLRLSQNSFLNMYWTLAQMVTHHTSNGCNLRTGDSLGSGTVSGPQNDALGCLLEITRQGVRRIADRRSRGGFCSMATRCCSAATVSERGNATLVGECRGTIVPAVSP